MSRLVYGAGPVRELIDSRPKQMSVLYVSGKRAGGDIAAAARQRGVAVETRSNAELDALAGARHQGLVAITGEYVYADTDDLVAAARGAALLVALDGVVDPHNLGAVARSAYLAGAHGLIVPRDRAASVTPVATKASAGATEHLPIAQVTNLTRTLAELKQAGLWLVAVAAAPDAVPIDTLDLNVPTCLVLGSEGAGIRRLVAAECDYRAVIPMAGTAVGSYNVSVAAGIALYEALRQRG